MRALSADTGASIQSGSLSRRAVLCSLLAQPSHGQKLEREVGITTSSLTGHIAVKPGEARIALLDLPRFVRQELDLRVIDLNTRTIQGATARELESLRKNASQSGCFLTNLKLNLLGLALDSADAAVKT